MQSGWRGIRSAHGRRLRWWAKRPGAGRIRSSDSRISAIAMSASCSRRSGKGPRGIRRDFDLLVFHMTGYAGQQPHRARPKPRTAIPITNRPRTGSCLMILNGADHRLFRGSYFHRVFRAGGYPFTRRLILAGFDCVLGCLRCAGTRRGGRWLYKGGICGAAGKQGTFETR